MDVSEADIDIVIKDRLQELGIEGWFCDALRLTDGTLSPLFAPILASDETLAALIKQLRSQEITMPRVEFTLHMPGRNSWDGRWSGDDRHYAIVRDLDEDQVEKLDGKSFSYAWPDGWAASVRVRRVPRGEKLKKSDGFHGYDWMVTSILQYGKIYADHERPAGK